jgi:hypothetical protein
MKLCICREMVSRLEIELFYFLAGIFFLAMEEIEEKILEEMGNGCG